MLTVGFPIFRNHESQKVDRYDQETGNHSPILEESRHLVSTVASKNILTQQDIDQNNAELRQIAEQLNIEKATRVSFTGQGPVVFRGDSVHSSQHAYSKKDRDD